MDLNKTMIIGRLTRDPELRNIADGTAVVNFSIATNHVYKDKSGNKKETVEYHDIVMWRKLAEIAAQYLRRGGKVYVEGRLQTRSWDDPNGFKRYKTEIVADNMIMLDRPSGGAATQPPAETSGAAQPSAPAPGAPAPQPPSEPKTAVAEDDLPTIEVGDESTDSAEVSVEDIPF